jgi:hypothetical protein
METERVIFEALQGTLTSSENLDILLLWKGKEPQSMKKEEEEEEEEGQTTE